MPSPRSWFLGIHGFSQHAYIFELTSPKGMLVQSGRLKDALQDGGSCKRMFKIHGVKGSCAFYIRGFNSASALS
ncbi:hypothetical protein MUK42_36531 [Musa troglodytarum]|uniref:Uncharacterized protein n=1 Tax=Musa troglodytarum TaxID=320322 RepID=A0A9E7JA29_9LILI|nr:hypothetical protein MUK42_36587 [Musa troglodytarum]URD76409.1 hypothetical protein MUK42_36531 [Musa troglodytarum]